VHFHRVFNANVLGLLTTTKVAVANFNSAGGSDASGDAAGPSLRI
jgi:hypothetical protein